MDQPEQMHTVIIGAGQAGLSVGYFLARLGLPFVILEANDRIGDSWRNRWDSLRLFTPARFSHIAGMPFPGAPNSFPTKNEMADYLEKYAGSFKLPVQLGVSVQRVSRRGERFLVEAEGATFEADNVVVAMATYQNPRVPAFARELDPAIVQLHSSEYRNPSQLRSGGVLIVGAGNSGAEIAVEVVRTHPTQMSGRDTGSVPFRPDSALGRILWPILFRLIFHRILTTGTPIGRRARPKLIANAAPLIRVKPQQLQSTGVERVARTGGVKNGMPLLADGRVLDVANVIWCTGFAPNNAWLELPVFEPNGEAIHARGVVESQPGLFFTGLHFLYAFSSTMIHGAERDAQFIVDAIQARAGNGQKDVGAPPATLVRHA